MEDKMLKEILFDIKNTCTKLDDNFKNICTRLDNIEERQSCFSEEFDTFRKEQITFREEFDTFCKEQTTFNNKILKELSDLRTDVDTIYELEKDARNTVKSHTEILNNHSKKLDQLINLSNINQEQHEDFDKRISFVESVVS